MSLLHQILPSFLSSVTTAELLHSLVQVSLPDTSDRDCEWSRNATLLLGKPWSLWDDALRQSFLERIACLVDARVEEAVSCLSVPSIKDTTFNVSSFVWRSASDAEKMELKGFALHPETEGVIEAFRQKTATIRKDLCLLEHQESSLCLAGERDLQSLRSLAADAFDRRLDNLLQRLLDLTTVQSSKVLPSCLMVRAVALLKSDLQWIYHLHPNPEQWLMRREKLLRQSHAWLSQHYNRRIEQHTVPLLKVSELSVDQETEALGVKEIKDREATPDTSGTPSPEIHVPVYPSISFMDFLTLVSREVNQVSGHGMPDEVSVAVLSKVGVEVCRAYRESLKSISAAQLPQSVKQRKALQRYFDLLVSKAVLTPVRCEQIRTNVLPKLLALVRSFEEILDPFDLHLMSADIQRNALLCIRNSSHLFTLFVPEYALDSVKKSLDSKASGGSEVLPSKASAGVRSLAAGVLPEKEKKQEIQEPQQS